MAEFPEIQGGGSLILAWQVRNKHVLVIGGGEVSATYLLALVPSHSRFLQDRAFYVC